MCSCCTSNIVFPRCSTICRRICPWYSSCLNIIAVASVQRFCPSCWCWSRAGFATHSSVRSWSCHLQWTQLLIVLPLTNKCPAIWRQGIINVLIQASTYLVVLDADSVQVPPEVMKTQSLVSAGVAAGRVPPHTVFSVEAKALDDPSLQVKVPSVTKSRAPM